MRRRASLAVVCALALCLASAGTVIAGSRRSSGSGTVRLVLGRQAFRAGQTVSVSIVNTGASLILRAFCFTLARQVGGRSVTITRTHGVSVPCVTQAGVPQPARTRQPLGLPLYDDLVPGRYIITLRYKPVTVRGPNLGNLTGPRVRAVSATLNALAFRPGPEPHLGERMILALAKRGAAACGDPAPTLVQHVESSRFEAVRISSGDLVFQWNWSYLIGVRGHFIAADAPAPPGAKVPGGSVLTLVVNAATGQVTDSGLGSRYPPLTEIGPVNTDLRATA